MKVKKYSILPAIAVVAALMAGCDSDSPNGTNQVEKKLERLYTKMFEGQDISSAEARGIVRQMLRESKEEAKREGTLNLPRNLGDMLLQKEATDEQYKSKLARLRREGVTDEDIRWWWNMHELERKMIQKTDHRFRMALWLRFREEGLSETEAAMKVAKSFPIFGHPDRTTLFADEDRALPYELRNRVNIYIRRRALTGREKFGKEMAEASSVNSLIRKAIREGHM